MRVLGERRTLDDLHHKIGAPAKFAGVQQADEVWMGKLGKRIHLGSESVLVGVFGSMQDLHCNWPVESGIECSIDSAHSPATEDGVETLTAIDHLGDERVISCVTASVGGFTESDMTRTIVARSTDDDETVAHGSPPTKTRSDSASDSRAEKSSHR